MSDSTPSDGDDDTTTSTRVRWTYLASLVAIVTIVGYVGLVAGAAVGLANLSMVPQSWFAVLSAIVLTATGWTFDELYTKFKDSSNKQ